MGHVICHPGILRPSLASSSRTVAELKVHRTTFLYGWIHSFGNSIERPIVLQQSDETFCDIARSKLTIGYLFVVKALESVVNMLPFRYQIGYLFVVPYLHAAFDRSGLPPRYGMEAALGRVGDPCLQVRPRSIWFLLPWSTNGRIKSVHFLHFSLLSSDLHQEKGAWSVSGGSRNAEGANALHKHLDPESMITVTRLFQKQVYLF